MGVGGERDTKVEIARDATGKLSTIFHIDTILNSVNALEVLEETNALKEQDLHLLT